MSAGQPPTARSGLANWGAPSRLAGHDLGDDAAGQAVLDVLAAQSQLDARFVARQPGYRSPRCQCLVTPDGERSFITHWPPDIRMTPASAAMLAGVGWLNLDMSGPLPPRLHAAQLAQARGIPVLVNDVYRADHPLLPLIDILVMSAAVARSKHPAKAPLELARDLQREPAIATCSSPTPAPMSSCCRGRALCSASPRQPCKLWIPPARATYSSRACSMACGKACPCQRRLVGARLPAA